MGLPASSASSHRGGLVAPCLSWRSARVDPAIGEDLDDRVEVEINARRRVPAVTAKAGEHFVHAVGGRRCVRILSRKTPAKAYRVRSSRSLRTTFWRVAGLFGYTKRNVSSTSRPFRPNLPSRCYASPRHLTTRGPSPPYLRCRKERRTRARRRRPDGWNRRTPRRFPALLKADYQ